MKKLIFIAVALLSMVSCYNDSLVWDTIHNHETRISELESKCREMNVNISSLSQIIEALQENDYVTSISEVVEDGEVVGYKITFSKSGSVFIYHGRNGKDGQDGEDGEDGANGSGGKDGYTPKIGVAKDIDGVYYWTLDGEWLLDENGEKIPTTGKDGQDGKDGVDGKDGEDGKDGTNGSDGEDGVDGEDGITPKLKIEDDYWYISYDDGISWHVLGEAVGEDGADGKDGIDGDSFFNSVTKDDNNVYLTLADGTVITIPLASSQLVNLIQSVTYVPVYKGGKAVFTKTYDENKGYAELDFIVNPSNVIAGLDTSWSDLLKFRCIETTTRAVNFIDLEIESYESDHDNGTFTIKVSGKALPDEFYRGKSSYSAALFIGDGSVASSFFELIAVESTDRPNMGLSTPYLSWGEIVDKVKEYMSYFELDYSDNVTLVYSGLKSEHLISYEFEEGKLVAVAMFVKEDMSTIDEVLTLLEGYDVLHEYDGTRGEYASSELNTYAEVCKSEKSGETYWFIGWSEYVVDEGYNTITYLSSNNKAIPINTLYGFGADIVANRYDNATNIGTIIFTGPVTSIPKQAFSGATTLTSIKIPGSVTTIGEEAFSGCNKLMSVTIPDSVTTIGGNAFYNCDSLININITDIASWCNISFSDSYSNPLRYSDNLYVNGELVTDLIIPDSVTFIGAYAFYDCSSLTSVTIPDSVTTIGGWAFYNCDSLININITDIASWCNISFSDSYSNPLRYSDNLYVNGELVTDLIIPESVTSIGDYAFYNCDSLTSVTIPDSVTTIGVGAFRYCSSLTSVTIPDSVTTIGGSAFRDCSSLTSVTIGNSVTTIEYGVFSGCSSLTSVTIPDSVTTIGEELFNNCYNLTNVTIGDSVTTIPGNTFSGCSNLTNVTIGNSVTAIADNTFSGFSKLTSVTIGDSVTTIGNNAFYDCDSLTSVTIPDSVVTIGEKLFSNCYNLTNVTIGDSVTTIPGNTFSGCSNLTNVTIGDSVTTIPGNTFSGFSKLTSVTIGNSVTTIGYDAFRDCDSLTSVNITDIASWCNISFSDFDSNPLCYAGNLYVNGELVTDLIIPDSVTAIGDYAFNCCDSLTSVTIGDSVTTIGDDAFGYCKSLTSVTIPDSVTTIGKKAFYVCGSLTSVTIGDSVTTIGDSAFNGCDSITSVTIGDSVTTIGDRAFEYCDSLTSVTIGDSVTTIGDWAFYSCDSLTSVYCKATIPPTLGGTYVFDNNGSGRKIFVPASDDDSIIKAYKNKKYWIEYAYSIYEYEYL